jgi:hypothetical protein
MIVERITCPACSEGIPPDEPDICLKKRDGSARHFYHRRCAREPERIVATEGKGVWSITKRQVFWNTGGGAA